MLFRSYSSKRSVRCSIRGSNFHGSKSTVTRDECAGIRVKIKKMREYDRELRGVYHAWYALYGMHCMVCITGAFETELSPAKSDSPEARPSPLA